MVRELKMYNVQAVCTGNNCRSRMMQADLSSRLQYANLQDNISVSSSGIWVDELRSWDKGALIPFRSIMKIYGVAKKNGFHRIAGHSEFINTVLDDHKAALKLTETDSDYRAQMNQAGIEVLRLITLFDRTSTKVALADAGLQYPEGKTEQTTLQGIDLYIAMEARHVGTLKQNAVEGEILCIDQFTGEEMGGSIGHIAYDQKTGILDVSGYKDLLCTVQKGAKGILKYLMETQQKLTQGRIL